MRSAVLWFALGTLHSATLADLSPKLLPKLQDVTRHLYNLEHARAAAICRGIIAESPDEPAGYVYLARTYWSEELSTRRALTLDRYAAADFFTEDSRYRIPISADVQTKFDEATATGIAKAKARLAADPNDAWSKFLLGVAYQNDASFSASLLHSWWTSFRQGTKAYKAHSELLAAHPEIDDARLVTGVYNYVAGTVPWKVRWLAALLGFHGSTTAGLADLERTTRNAVLDGDDARVLLALLYTREKKYDAAFTKLSELHTRYPRNYLAYLDVAGVELRMGHAADAVKTYTDILDKVNRHLDGYERLDRATVYSALGVATRAAGDLRGSEAWLRRSLAEASAAAPTLARAHIELGKTFDLQGRRDDAVLQYRQAQQREAPSYVQREAAVLLGRPYKQ